MQSNFGITPGAQAPLSTLFNQLALLAVCGSLVEAFFYQFAFNEIPCPLCLLQRAAMILVGIALVLNLKFGASAVHYAMILVSALVGGATSMRQGLLHIAPGDPGYGSTLLGLHFYTWGFVFFVGMILFCAVMLCVDRNRMAFTRPLGLGIVSSAIIGLFLVLIAANSVSAVLECGVGPCPDNPTAYLFKF